MKRSEKKRSIHLVCEYFSRFFSFKGTHRRTFLWGDLSCYDVSRYWYQKSLHVMLFPLVPFSWLFGMGSACRRFFYRAGIIKTKRFPVPVIIVGNITVGGTGKTPFVIWLATFLQENGYQPGIVSRGVGGLKQYKPHVVLQDDDARVVGDEALLLAQRTKCPVVISVDRPAAAATLLAQSNCNVIISDDGLQHYRLARDFEIVIIDGARRFGNGYLLPAGPLREQKTRLKQVDWVVVNEGDWGCEYTFALQPKQLISLKENKRVELSNFYPQSIHAVAGIGNPERFFRVLTKCGFEIIPHVFPDHHDYEPGDMDFKDSLPIVMTKKDAVKCKRFADERYWYLDITVKIDGALQKELLMKIKGDVK